MADKSDDDKRVNPIEDNKESKEEQDLDDALDDTFPASDPLPVTPKADPKTPGERRGN